MAQWAPAEYPATAQWSADGSTRKLSSTICGTSRASQVSALALPGTSAQPASTVLPSSRVRGETRMNGDTLPCRISGLSCSETLSVPYQVLDEPGQPGISSTTGNFLSRYAGSSYCGGSQTSTSPSIPESRPLRSVRRTSPGTLGSSTFRKDWTTFAGALASWAPAAPDPSSGGTDGTARTWWPVPSRSSQVP